MSPIGFLLPQNQLIQYERYINMQHSLTTSLSYSGNAGYGLLLNPPRTERLTTTRATVGYRYYFPGVGIGDELTVFASARAVVDYSNLKLASDPRYAIPTDSLRAAGVSLGPEFLFGGKITLFKRISLSGAIGGHYLFNWFSTEQITRNQPYWDAFYWTNDNQDWQYKRNIVANFRRGWSSSLLITVGVVLGKRPN